MNLKTNNLLPRDCISTDHYESIVRGFPTYTNGKERETEQLWGGTIAVEHASSKIYIYHQVSLRAGETLQAKQFWGNDLLQYGFCVKRYHSDNRIFPSAEFKANLHSKKQVIDFSSTGAHHQNALSGSLSNGQEQ